tara:strand:+ start:11099 stop:11524 length:426 start_codon:yes stop_codon:yes gene_type:complete
MEIHLVSRVLPLLIASAVNSAAAAKVEPSPNLLGRWEAFSAANIAIYSSIEISKSQLKWGDMSGSYLCSSKYDLERSGKQEKYQLTLVGKECDYDRIHNSHIHRMLGAFEFEIYRKNGRLEAEVTDYDQGGDSMGWGVFRQ